MNLRKIVGAILSLVMIALTIYVLGLQHRNTDVLYKSTDLALTASDHATSNYRTYVGKYKETKIELDETTKKLEVVKTQLNQVSAELATTRGEISQTQRMLSEAQEENTHLKQELRDFDDLRHRNSQLSLQLEDLKKQLRDFEGEFSNLAQGQSLVVLFQNKIKLVKSRMNNLKQEAFFARIAVQKEKDRLAVLNGNSGFVVRNGQVQNPNGTKKSFAIDVRIVQ